jgi:hypothetical protein
MVSTHSSGTVARIEYFSSSLSELRNPSSCEHENRACVCILLRIISETLLQTHGLNEHSRSSYFQVQSLNDYSYTYREEGANKILLG